MSLKKKYDAEKNVYEVTFTVSKEAAQGAQKITIAGDFNSWSSTETPLSTNKKGDFSVKLTLEAGKEYQFRYLLDGKRWENDWNADKYIPAPFSHTDNSVVICIPTEAEKNAVSEKKVKKTSSKKASK